MLTIIFEKGLPGELYLPVGFLLDTLLKAPFLIMEDVHSLQINGF